MRPNYEYVDKFYEMDPATEDLLFDSTHLRNGMKILLGDPGLRENLIVEEMTPQKAENAKVRNRWFTVSDLHPATSNEPRWVSFIANFEDGTKRKVITEVWWPWLVKKNGPTEFDAFGAARHYDTGEQSTAIFRVRGSDPEWENEKGTPAL